jgi:hypothetical protein
MFALLLLAACPMLSGSARGQEVAVDPPKPLVQYTCTINTACYNGTKIPGTDKPFTSDPKDSKYLAWQDAIYKMKKYEIDYPCVSGYSRQQYGPYIFDPPFLVRSGTSHNCCPTDGKWKVTIQCIVDDGTPNGTPVNFPCFGNTRLKAKRAAEAELKTFLCQIGQNCKCCKVFTERVKPTPVCCN